MYIIAETIICYCWETMYYECNLLRHTCTYIKRTNKGNNKITELRTILQRESQNS
jgi:hypothetical protein